MNNVNLIGRLTREPELRYSSGGVAISNFSIAVNSKRKQGDKWVDEVDYFDCTLFGKQAESLDQYLTKGKQVGIAGRLKQNRWEKDGQNYSKVVVIVNQIDLLGGTERQSPQGGYPQQRQSPQGPESFEGDSFDDEQIPF
jgi:single-strand DNA-binding protein